MKNWKRLAALALVLTLVLSLFTGCFGSGEEDEGEIDDRNIATAGGSIAWPDGFDTSARRNSMQVGDTFYFAFNRTQNSTASYFTPAGDTLTVTGQATTESENRKEYRVTLWRETTGAREYVDTLYLTADGSCYQGSFTGLDTGSRYKIGVAYDGGSYYLSGGVTVTGLADGSAAA